MGNKPEIIMMDTGGINNGDLEGTRSRLIRGASWKRQRVIMILPAAETMPSKVVLSYLNLAFPPNNGVCRILALGQEVGEAYSNAIGSIIADPNLSEFEYILCCEHDNAPPADGALKLIEQMENHPEFSVIGGLYFTKGFGSGVAQIWGDPKDPVLNFRPQVPNADGSLQECCGTGMGFTMFRTSIFKDTRLRRPWFKTQTVGGVSTQDLYFFADARKYGYRAAIDTSVRVGHYDLRGDFGLPDTMY